MTDKYGLIWEGENRDWSDVEYTGKLSNLDFIVGTETDMYIYALASRSVEIKKWR